jgi:dihydrofolate reductase
VAVKIYVAASLDGFIADRDGNVDWLLPFQTIDYGYERFLSSVATVVMGRISFEFAKSFGPWPYAAQRSIVITTRRIEVLPPDVETSADVASVIEEVRAAPSDTWVMGGAQIMGAFLDAGAVDHMEIYVIPVLLAEGTRLFARTGPPQSFKLTQAHAFQNGVVKTAYAKA